MLFKALLAFTGRLAGSARPVLAAAAALLAVATAPALAADLDSYRAQGVIAERFDGLAFVRVGNAPADAVALVEEVNAKRRAIYEQRAREKNAPLREVGKLYASEIIERAPAGTYFQQPDGTMVRK